ncbi:MAG: pyridoxamine 5'-phosphate oxidase family protein [Planctomycetota bacterium]
MNSKSQPEDATADPFRVITEFLGYWQIAGLATCGPGGEPYAANVVYACDPSGFFYFASDEASTHAGHLAVDPRAAFSIYAPRSDAVQGVQATGLCRPLQPGTPPYVIARQFYLLTLEGTLDPSERRDRLDRETLYCARLEWAKYTDSTRSGSPLEWQRDA